MQTEKKYKICSRGHRYTGTGPCTICWPGRLKKHQDSKKKLAEK